MSVVRAATVVEKVVFRRNLLLRQIRRTGAVGRLELARQLHLSKSRVCEVVQGMLKDNLLLEDGAGTKRRGPHPVPVRVNPEYGQMLGFDFEAKRMRLVAVDFAGNVTWSHQERLRPMRDRQALIDRLLTTIAKGLDMIRAERAAPLGIGLAVPGIVDMKTGTILHYDFIDAARDIPLRDLVASHTGLPCSLEKNIPAYALTEWMSGAAQHLSNFVCLAVRSGVGVAMLRDGRVIRGSHGFSGGAGYFAIPGDRPASQWKTLQDTVSEHALSVDVEAKGFALSEAKAKRAGELVGAQLAALATLLDPEAVVLAGGLIQPDGPLWRWIERTFRRFLLPDIADRVQLLPSRVGPLAAAIGATHRCFQMLYPTTQDGQE